MGTGGGLVGLGAVGTGGGLVGGRIVGCPGCATQLIPLKHRPAGHAHTCTISLEKALQLQAPRTHVLGKSPTPRQHI